MSARSTRPARSMERGEKGLPRHDRLQDAAPAGSVGSEKRDRAACSARTSANKTVPRHPLRRGERRRQPRRDHRRAGRRRRCFTLRAAASIAPNRPKTSWPAPSIERLCAHGGRRSASARAHDVLAQIAVYGGTQRWRMNYKNDFPMLSAYVTSPISTTRPRPSARSACLMQWQDFYRCHNANPLRGLYPLSVEATDML